MVEKFSTAKKIISWKNALKIRKKIARGGGVFVFTNGCFDLIHAGHIKLLESARSMGSYLLVGLNSDSSVRKLRKGPGRPVSRQADRAKILAALEAVDGVAVFKQATPLEIIKLVRPDVLVKGADYGGSEIVGREFAGKVERVRLLPKKSTTKLLLRYTEAQKKEKM